MLDFLPTEVLRLAAALAIGLLIGLEREQRKAADGGASLAAGVRTFALIALAGAVAAILGTVAVVLAGAFVALAAVASFWLSQKKDPGLTTEVAMLVAFLLGVLAMAKPAFAAALGVLVAVILASKTRLHAFAQRVLSEQELHDLLLLAAAAVIVLPLLPDRPLDPWNALNPRRVWLLVVIVMALNGAGYVALRALGPKAGLVLTGLTGGFVSSTATIGSMGSRAQLAPKLINACAAGGLASNIATVVQLALIIGAVSMPLLRLLAVPLGATALVAVIAAGIAGWRSFREPVPDGDALRGRAFKISHALIFAAVVAGVLLISAVAREQLGQTAYIATIALSGFADTHAAAASVAQLVAAGGLEAQAGVLPVLAAFTANSISKLVVAAGTGGAGFFWRMAPGVIAMNVVFAVMALVVHL